MYFCLNITTNHGEPGAVLIRALEPLDGLNIMKSRRKTENLTNLTSGPGKLCQALNININLNKSQVNDKIKVFHYKTFSEKEIGLSKRVGISKGTDLDWRFYIKNNKNVSSKDPVYS